MSAPGEKKEQKQERAISALLNAPSLREAAKEAGISEATLHRWLKKDDFKTAYREAKKELVNHAIYRLQHATGKAVNALEAVIDDKESPASARVSAAKTILETSIKVFGIEELEQRIFTLEKLIQERGVKH